MKATTLIKKLSEIITLNPDANVYLDDAKDYYDFTGFSSDDNNDIQLFISGGDKKANNVY